MHTAVTYYRLIARPKLFLLYDSVITKGKVLLTGYQGGEDGSMAALKEFNNWDLEFTGYLSSLLLLQLLML